MSKIKQNRQSNKIPILEEIQNVYDVDFSKLKRLSFVKRHGENIKNNYPEFPKYDSEDDWL